MSSVPRLRRFSDLPLRVYGRVHHDNTAVYVAGLSWLHIGGTQYAGETARRPAGLFAADLRVVDGIANDVRAGGLLAGKGFSAMNDIGRLFQAFLAPAIFVSATALLILPINVRLMGIVSRLRQFVHARHDAARSDRAQEAEAYTTQIESIERRADLIRRCFLLALVALAGVIASCLLLGLGLYVKHAALVAVIAFVLALICLFAASIYYAREVRVALSSVQEEERDLRFMDLGTHREHEHQGTI